MGLFDKLKERFAPSAPPQTYAPQGSGARRPGGAAKDPDEAAVERYRYMLRTAPPETIEQAHAEAFATLTPEQRRTVLTELGSQVPASERAASDDPKALARMATRAEMRQPGLLERTFSGRGGGMGGGYGMGGGMGMGMGGMLAGGLFASMAGAFVGTAIAEEIFNDDHDNDAGDNNDDDGNNDNGNDGNDSGNDGSGDNSGGDQSDAQTVSDSGDYGSGGYDGGDYGNDGYGGGDGSGDAFGGFGGGDYGGGFGGGDYGGGDVGGGDLGGGFDA